MSASLAQLRSLVQRHGSSANSEDFGRLSTGLAELDRDLGGGVPRGGLTEILAPIGSGGGSLAMLLAASCTRQGYLAAWIDPSSSFDPSSAEALGVRTENLLWIRPPRPRALYESLDVVLEHGNFPLVLLDLGLLPELSFSTAHWARWSRRLRDQPVALVVLSSHPRAGSLGRTTLELMAPPEDASPSLPRSLLWEVRRNRQGPVGARSSAPLRPQRRRRWAEYSPEGLQKSAARRSPGADLLGPERNRRG